MRRHVHRADQYFTLNTIYATQGTVGLPLFGRGGQPSILRPSAGRSLRHVNAVAPHPSSGKRSRVRRFLPDLALEWHDVGIEHFTLIRGSRCLTIMPPS